jgi:hypothetical protein
LLRPQLYGKGNFEMVLQHKLTNCDIAYKL